MNKYMGKNKAFKSEKKKNTFDPNNKNSWKMFGVMAKGFHKKGT